MHSTASGYRPPRAVATQSSCPFLGKHTHTHTSLFDAGVRLTNLQKKHLQRAEVAHGLGKALNLIFLQV